MRPHIFRWISGPLCFFWLCSLVDAGRAPATEPLRELFEEAVEVKGVSYSAIKNRILRVKGARESLRQWVAAPGVTWQQRMTAKAVLGDLENPTGRKELMAALARHVIHASKPKRRGASRQVWESSAPDPRDLRQGVRPALDLHRLAEDPGLIHEILSKHTPDTLAPILARVAAEDQKKRQKEWDETDHGLGREAPVRPRAFTPQEWLEKQSAAGRASMLCLARRAAAQALVLVGDDVAVTMLQGLGTEGSLRAMMGSRMANAAVECLEQIGTDAATAALRGIATAKARSALRRLEARKRKERRERE